MAVGNVRHISFIHAWVDRWWQCMSINLLNKNLIRNDTWGINLGSGKPIYVHTHTQIHTWVDNDVDVVKGQQIPGLLAVCLNF